MAERAARDRRRAPTPSARSSTRAVRPNGLRVERVRVPLGVIGVVYENRPNVTSDVAGLCVRSGNAAYLRGSASAQAHQRRVVVRRLRRRAREARACRVARSPWSRTPATRRRVAFMQLTDVIDCLIPRGGPSLIAAMREHARVPYVLDGDGNCHVYVDASADLDMAVAIVVNAKTSRPGVCNAAETLLVHRDVAAAFLPRLAAAMPQVELRADDGRARAPARRDAGDRGGLRSASSSTSSSRCRSSDSLDEAIDARRALRHRATPRRSSPSDAANADAWVARVDAAAVLVNASTRFIDGGELGLGGEVGISTQKLHARGPDGAARADLPASGSSAGRGRSDDVSTRARSSPSALGLDARAAGALRLARRGRRSASRRTTT